MDQSRIFKFQGVHNFREIGGLAAIGTKKIRRGILFRSDELSGLTATDLKKLDQLKIKLIIDLRTPAERKTNPDRLPAGSDIRIVNRPIYNGDRDLSQFQFMKLLIVNGNRFDFEAFVKGHYHSFAFKRTAEIKEILNLISEEKNLPALIHCSAGKDRTGLIAAIIQLLAGARQEEVIEDYLVSNHLLAERSQMITNSIRFMSFYRISTERIKPLLEARREYLENVLNLIYNKYGSIENYLLEACGMKPAGLTKIKELIAN